MNIRIDRLIRSKRKTIGLQITPEAALVVRAPKSANIKAIENVIAKHEDWIRTKQEFIRSHPRILRSKKFTDGEEFLFLGHPYKLNILENDHIPLTFAGDFHISRKHLSEAKRLFINWYISRAKDIIPERVCLQAQRIGYKLNSIHISKAKTRWGSCSSRGKLNFSWRLVMSPIESIDYVVIHELAHLKHRDHSKIFWGEVERMMPDYKNHRLWLKKNESLMVL